MRLTTEVGPRPRRAGRNWGNCTEAGVAEVEPGGRAEDEAEGCAGGETAGFAGVAEALGLTWTSAAKRLPRAIRAAARVNQNLNIECLRNAVLALSQAPLFTGAGDRDYFLCDLFPCPLP